MSLEGSEPYSTASKSTGKKQTRGWPPNFSEANPCAARVEGLPRTMPPAPVPPPCPMRLVQPYKDEGTEGPRCCQTRRRAGMRRTPPSTVDKQWCGKIRAGKVSESPSTQKGVGESTKVPRHGPQRLQAAVEGLELVDDDVDYLALPVDPTASKHGVGSSGDGAEPIEDA